MRSRCKILVAFGDCAVFGGVPALRNMCGTQEALMRAYVDAESNDDKGFIPSDPELAVMSNVRALHEVVSVDLFVPGCPPDPDVIYYVLKELAEGRMPEIKHENLHWH
jgi:NAD-reducing hydrogenase small subunit